jgi:hypothetical protein
VLAALLRARYPVAAGGGSRQDAPRLVSGQRLDIDVLADRRIDQAGHVATVAAVGECRRP